MRRSQAPLVVAIAMVLTLTACNRSDGTTSDTTVDTTTVGATESTTSTPPTTSAPATVPETTTPPPTTPPPTTAPATTVPAVERDFSAITPIVQQVVDEQGLNGAGLVVVDRDEGVVHEQYWGEFDADRRSFIASSSKMIVAGVLMRLADDGALDLDVPIADQFGWTGNPTLTPVQLVSNLSGFVGLFPDIGYPPYRCQFLPAGELERCGASIFETPDDDADIVPPDTAFRYGGGQWQVAGAIAETASGRSWAELIDEIYVQPCGVDSLGFGNHFIRTSGLQYPHGVDPSDLGPTDNPNMEGGAFVDVPDYGALLLMHLREGRCDETQVISPAGIERLHTDRTAELGLPPGYAMGWWVDRSTGRLRDPGAYGAVPWIDVDLGYGAYLVVEADGTTGDAIMSLIEPIIDDAMATS